MYMTKIRNNYVCVRALEDTNFVGGGILKGTVYPNGWGYTKLGKPKLLHCCVEFGDEGGIIPR